MNSKVVFKYHLKKNFSSFWCILLHTFTSGSESQASDGPWYAQLLVETLMPCMPLSHAFIFLYWLASTYCPCRWKTNLLAQSSLLYLVMGTTHSHNSVITLSQTSKYFQVTIISCKMRWTSFPQRKELSDQSQRHELPVHNPNFADCYLWSQKTCPSQRLAQNGKIWSQCHWKQRQHHCNSWMKQKFSVLSVVMDSCSSLWIWYKVASCKWPKLSYNILTLVSI